MGQIINFDDLRDQPRSDDRPRLRVVPNREHPYVRRVLEEADQERLAAYADLRGDEMRLIARECWRERGHNSINMAGADWSGIHETSAPSIGRAAFGIGAAVIMFGMLLIESWLA